jgi:hypothetical protein
MKELIEEFIAVDESGKEYTINVLQNFTIVTSLNADTYPMPAWKEVIDQNNNRVNDHGDGTFTIVSTGVKLTRIDNKIINE